MVSASSRMDNWGRRRSGPGNCFFPEPRTLEPRPPEVLHNREPNVPAPHSTSLVSRFFKKVKKGTFMLKLFYFSGVV